MGQTAVLNGSSLKNCEISFLSGKISICSLPQVNDVI